MGKQLSYLIIGNGISGVTAAEILRSEDPASSITIVANDPFPVYYRPALKDFLGGSLNEEKLWARPNTFYKEQRICFVPGRVMGINTVQNFVQLHNGQRIGYHKLLLANGARPRQLSCPGLNLAGVTTLRTIVDYQEILRRLESAKRIVICGSGTLALESAETLNHRGYEVTHLLRQHRLWSEVLDPIASDLVLQEERRDGIDVRTEEEIAEIIGRKGQVVEVITTSGARIPCDMVLIAIGIEPLIDFIRASGVACGRGVRVDNSMRTSVPHIYAAGDVIERTDVITGRTRVLGQWYPAIEQARTAAYSMLGQLDSRAAATSGSNYYNATFLYGLDFVAVGLTTIPPNAQGYQEIVADPQPRNYRKVILHNGIPLGTLHLGDRKHALAFKRAIDHQVNLASIANRLFADNFNLDEWLDNQGVLPDVLDLVRIGQSHTRPHMQQPQGSSLHYGKVETPSLLGQTDESMRAYLVPLPHPKVNVTVQETEIGSGKQGEVITIGRQKGSSLLIKHNSVSRLHSEIIYLNENYLLRDRGSSNGTFVNNTALDAGIYMLRNLDLVRFGDVQFRFELRQQPVSNGTTPSTASTVAFPHVQGTQLHANVSRTIPDSVLATLKETPMLVLTGQNANPRTVALESERRLTIGRSKEESHLPVVVGMSHRSDVKTQSEERLRFEIDMCIGCDRCMSACPIPISTLVNIADLNHATISNEVAAHVARFTHECIMCGSCVPVCPVDNHRDLLMLSLKQRVGVAWDSQADLSRIAESLPSGWTLEHLISRLRQHRFLSNGQLVPENYLLHLVVSSRLRLLAPGETVINEGEYGRDLYLILEGRLTLSASEFPVAVLSPGEHTGEDGMLTGQPYKATAQAQVPTLVLQIPEQVMQRLMELVPTVQLYFDPVNNARSLKSILKRMALFQGVSDADIQALIQQTPVKQYERNERLFAEDDRGGRPSRETLHILLEGFVKVARHTLAGTGRHKGNERIVAYRQGGDYFAGGLDLLGDGRAVSVTAINRVRVAEVPRQVMLALFQQYPEVNQRFALRLREYLETSVTTQGYALTSGPLIDFSSVSALPDVAVQAGLHSLVSDGVVEGTEVLVIDLDKCIHCSECEEACARRHGYSRMNRKGMVVGNISISTACRQCQDPVCMLCSRAGIARHPNGEVYITESCIGCGICAERCPYGAISIINIEDEPVSHSSWQRFSKFFAKGVNLGTESNYAAPGPLDTFQSRNAFDEMRKKVAIKCDLCAGYKDQACVVACSTGAAVRIQPTKFFGSTEEILRRRAL